MDVKITYSLLKKLILALGTNNYDPFVSPNYKPLIKNITFLPMKDYLEKKNFKK